MSGSRRGDAVNDVYAALAARVGQQAQALNLTPEDMASASGIVPARLDDILDGRARDVHLHELAGLALTLDLTVAELLSPPDSGLVSGAVGCPLPIQKLV